MEHPNVRRVVAAAADAGLAIAPVRYPDGTRTAADAARSIGCEVAKIVKSLVFMAGDVQIVALVCGSDRLDPARLAAELGVDGSSVRRADADDVRAATGYAIGGVPPLGHAQPLTVLMDRGLLRFDEVWAAAGLPDTSFGVAPLDLARAAGARLGDIAQRD